MGTEDAALLAGHVRGTTCCRARPAPIGSRVTWGVSLKAGCVVRACGEGAREARRHRPGCRLGVATLGCTAGAGAGARLLSGQAPWGLVQGTRPTCPHVQRPGGRPFPTRSRRSAVTCHLSPVTCQVRAAADGHSCRHRGAGAARGRGAGPDWGRGASPCLSCLTGSWITWRAGSPDTCLPSSTSPAGLTGVRREADTLRVLGPQGMDVTLTWRTVSRRAPRRQPSAPAS